MPEIEDRYHDLLQQQKSNYVQRCVCVFVGLCVCGFVGLCVWVFAAASSTTEEGGLGPVQLHLWQWHIVIRVLRSVFKYYLFPNLVHFIPFLMSGVISHVCHVIT